MELNFLFFVNSLLFGVGLSMDAFSVSVANGLNDPHMKKRKLLLIAATFAVFQAVMPLTGWLCVHTVVSYFTAFEKFVPWIALLLLTYIGIKMIVGAGKDDDGEASPSLGFGALIVQGIATSIDALSVGFTIADYNAFSAVLCALIIASVTFVLSSAGVVIGKKFGGKFSGKAEIIGGIILILIGIEIFIKSFFS